MDEKINSFEILLREGAVFDVPLDGNPWVLEDQAGNEICQGKTFLEMIKNSPNPTPIIFSDLEIGKYFTYLEQEYLKKSAVSGLRVHDNFVWRFKGSEEIYQNYERAGNY